MKRKEQIFNYLKDSAFGRMSLTAISKACGIDKGAAVNVLRKLENENLVSREKLGKFTIYFLTT